MSELNGHLRSSAIWYAEKGYRVFPCVPGTKTPLTEHGFKDATSDPAQVEKWWQETPHANIGIATEGMLVVDVDGSSNPWLRSDPDKAVDLAKAPISLTPGGGRHYVFREPPDAPQRNTTSKLAPKVDTRAAGGYIVAPPSMVDGNSYSWVEGCALDEAPDHLPEPPQWLVALLAQTGPTNAPSSPQGAPSATDGNPIPSGQRNATLARLAGTMRRVGMGYTEIRAAIAETNANRCNPPLSDAEVDRVAASICRYEPDQVSVAVVENHYAQDCADEDEQEQESPAFPDPGPMPETMLRVPGLVSELMDYCLDTAPYPNPVMAFCGALSLQAFLAGRKVRDPGDNRTNLYLLGLAHSAAGKDWPRKINTRILHALGLAECLGDRFASGEGIQDALFANPCMLFQTDEIDGMLQQISKAQDARHENVMGTLLTMYSSANSVFPMRRKAGKESPGAIDQPCLSVFGTAIPNHYYQALSERMLTNGFFARMIILESGPRCTGQEPTIKDIPTRVMATSKWWADFHPGTGNLQNWHPVPAVVDQDDEAKLILVATREEAEAEYAKAETANDPVGTTVWGRVSEQTRKLALLHAVSESPKKPVIGKAAAIWATEFVMHQTKRMLFMAHEHVYESEFHGKCKKLIKVLREWEEKQGDDWMPFWRINRKLPWNLRDHEEVRDALLAQKVIEYEEQKTGGTPKRVYRIR